MTRLYPILSEKDLLKLSKVGTLVSTVKKTTIPVKGGAVLKDMQDQRLDS